MKKVLLLIIFLLSSVSIPLVAQQINFNGIRVMHTTGTNNMFLGINTGLVNTGNSNTFLGPFAGNRNTTGSSNSFVGAYAGGYNTIGYDNVFLGRGAGYSNINGSNNTFVGRETGAFSTTANNNSFIGAYAGSANTVGTYNSFIGAFAGNANTTGSTNVFIGVYTGINSTNANDNTFVGPFTGVNTSTGSYNTFIGRNTGYVNTTGRYNTLLGYQADVKSNDLFNATAIGMNAVVAVNNAIVLGDPTNADMKVGIGTDSPQFPLDVRGTINLRNRGTIKFSHLRNPNLKNGSTDQFLTVDEQGETLLARYRLTINNANEWSDKVFAPSYQLRPLASVAAYIGQHGHLPGVPSAEQVVREGLDMNMLQSTLLEKIEELTLYTIQLEKANRQQQADIAELKRLVKQALAK